jgi:two-component system cell cycle response regulator DivK
LPRDKSEFDNCIGFEDLGEGMHKTILVAEDTEDSRQLMKILLEIFGFVVIEAENGQQAVMRAAEQRPDLILMDISMPVMDGLTATKAIRKFEASSKVPIIAVTAHGKSFYEQAIKAGCNDLIPKPVDFDMLKPVIEQYLGH